MYTRTYSSYIFEVNTGVNTCLLFEYKKQRVVKENGLLVEKHSLWQLLKTSDRPKWCGT